MLNRVLTGLTVAIVLADVAVAAIVQKPSYTRFAIRQRADLDRVAAANQLDPAEGALAIETAALWVFIGPCRGSQIKLPENKTALRVTVLGAMQFVAFAKPENPLHAAVLTMIAIMIRDYLGRTVSADLCRFDLDTVVPYRSVP